MLWEELDVMEYVVTMEELLIGDSYLDDDFFTDLDEFDEEEDLVDTVTYSNNEENIVIHGIGEDFFINTWEEPELF